MKKEETNQTEQAFINVMSIQQKYHWLGHYHERTPEELEEINRNINRRIFGINNKDHINRHYRGGRTMLKTAILIGLVAIATLTGCKKSDDTKPQAKKEMITQEIKLTNFQTIPIPAPKQFDLNQWIWNFNPDKFQLIFHSKTSPMDDISIGVNIEELLAGVNVNIIKGTYDISFKSIHNTNDLYFSSSKLDIEINMPDVQINGVPIQLSGSYTDFLVILDVPDIQSASYDGSGILPIIQQIAIGNEYFYYAYVDPQVSTDLGNLIITYTSGKQPTAVQTPLIPGSVYRIVGAMANQTNIVFPSWLITRITI